MQNCIHHILFLRISVSQFNNYSSNHSNKRTSDGTHLYHHIILRRRVTWCVAIYNSVHNRTIIMNVRSFCFHNNTRHRLDANSQSGNWFSKPISCFVSKPFKVFVTASHHQTLTANATEDTSVVVNTDFSSFYSFDFSVFN